jgi:hypothetical protein
MIWQQTDAAWLGAYKVPPKMIVKITTIFATMQLRQCNVSADGKLGTFVAKQQILPQSQTPPGRI